MGGTHLGGRGRFQSLSFAGLGGGHDDLPKRQLFHEIQQVHPAPVGGGQKDFMPEDTEAGQIQGFLEHYTGSMVCSKQLFKEALGHTYEEPKRWQLHNINEIMNTVVTGWKPFSNPRMFAGYGRQMGWERDVSGNELPGNEDGFVELSEEECRQLELPKEWIA